LIAQARASSGAEIANTQKFIERFFDALGVPRPISAPHGQRIMDVTSQATEGMIETSLDAVIIQCIRHSIAVARFPRYVAYVFAAH
jgi:hypothetical protein